MGVQYWNRDYSNIMEICGLDSSGSR